MTSCTSLKADDSRRMALRAEDLYTGQQHVRLMRGVRAYREAGEPWGGLDLHVLSAGHGLVAGDSLLEHYDETFSGRSRSEVRRAGERLRVPDDVAALLSRPWRLVITLLGDFYLQAARIDASQSLGGPMIAFTSPRSGARLPALRGMTIVPLHNREAKRFSCGLTSLKGELGGRLLQRLASDDQVRVPTEHETLLDWLEVRPAPHRSSCGHQLEFAA